MTNSAVAAPKNAAATTKEPLAPAVTIEAVDDLVEPRPRRAAQLVSPTPESTSDLFAIEFGGWVATDLRARTVRLTCDDEVLAETPADMKRGQSRVGFRTKIGAFRLPLRFSVDVRAITDEGESLAIARVLGSRISLGPSDDEELLSPVLVSTPTGRTGTTWLVHLLSMHPSLIAYPPFGTEPRLASYWLEAMGSLAEPGSYLQALHPRMQNPHWFLGAWPHAARVALKDPEVGLLLGRHSVERFAAFARERVDAFYRLAAEQQAKSPRAFVEKAPYGRMRLEAIEDLFGSLRELTLFRDPRDILCSILAYQAARPGRILISDSLEAGRESMVEIANSCTGMLKQTEERRDRALMIRYEDLVQRPTPTLRRAFAHLGIADDTETVERVCALAASGDPGKVHRTSPDPASSIGRWKRDLDPRLRAMADEIFRDVLDELGYDTAHDGKAREGTGAHASRRRPDHVPAKSVRILAAAGDDAAWLARLLGDLRGVVVEEPDGDSAGPEAGAAPASEGAVLVIRDSHGSAGTEGHAGLEAARQAYDSHAGPKAMVTVERLQYAPLDTLREISRSLELAATDLDLAHVVVQGDRGRTSSEPVGPGADSGYREPADG